MLRQKCQFCGQVFWIMNIYKSFIWFISNWSYFLKPSLRPSVRINWSNTYNINSCYLKIHCQRTRAAEKLCNRNNSNRNVYRYNHLCTELIRFLFHCIIILYHTIKYCIQLDSVILLYPWNGDEWVISTPSAPGFASLTYVF